MKLTKYFRIVLFLSFILLISTSLKAEEPIKIASIFAKTGVAAADNFFVTQTVKYAVEDLNKKGGVLGRKLELIEFDNNSTPSGSETAARKAVEAEVTAVIGASWSSHSIAMAPVLQQAEIPMISPHSTNPEVTKKGNYIFRACFIDPFQGEVLAKFVISELNAKTAAILKKQGSPYSLGLSYAFSKYFTQTGGKIIIELEYEQEQKNFKTLLSQIKESDPDVLFIPGHSESSLIVKRANETGIKSILLGGDAWTYPRFLGLGGHTIKLAYYTSHWTKDVDTEQSRKFVKEYEKVHKIQDTAGCSYDAVALLADAIRRAGSTDRAKVRQALADTRNFEGITGNISLNEDGDPIKPAVIMKIVNGKASYYKTVYP